MIRFALILALFAVVARAFWRAVDGVIAGLSGPGAARTPQRSSQMVRDPVCGTFVLPDQALSVSDGSRRVFFCSTRCRDEYRTRK